MNPAQKLKTISVLPPASTLEVLRMLAGSAQNLSRAEAGDLAKVTLFLAGATFSGYVAGIREDGEASYILFLEHDDERSQSINVVYLPAWSITAVRVHEAEQFLHTLSGGKVGTRKAAVGIATLRHKIADEVMRLRTVVQSDIKLEVSWETLTQDALSLLGLYELVDSFMQALHATIADEFKAIAFKNFVAVIRFQNSPEAEIQQEGQTLLVRANLKSGLDGRFTCQEFTDALETLLTEP